MVTTLARINGEALAVPGLRFWARRDSSYTADGWTLYSLIASDERGASELWCFLERPAMGGIEYHQPVPHAEGDVPHSANCEIRSGACYREGSSWDWRHRFLPLVKTGDSRGVLRLLADCHSRAFEGVAR